MSQIFDYARLGSEPVAMNLATELPGKVKNPVIFVMDYAFGRQAYETMMNY